MNYITEWRRVKQVNRYGVDNYEIEKGHLNSMFYNPVNY